MNETCRMIALAILFVSACGEDTDDSTSSSGDGTGGETACVNCPGGEKYYLCECQNENKFVCAEDEQALGACFQECGHTAQHVNPVACSTYDPTGRCSEWDPESSIRLDEGIYYVETDLIRDLIADPAPLWSCDTMVVEAAGAVFELSGGATGELLYELGLRDGDMPEELNGMPLFSYAEVAAAFTHLWHAEEETEYELRIRRPTSTGPIVVTLHYELI